MVEYFLTASFNIDSMIHFVFTQGVSYEAVLDLAAVEAVLLPNITLSRKLCGIHRKLYVQQ